MGGDARDPHRRAIDMRPDQRATPAFLGQSSALSRLSRGDAHWYLVQGARTVGLKKAEIWSRLRDGLSFVFRDAK
jgi:hypothetical protein